MKLVKKYSKNKFMRYFTDTLYYLTLTTLHCETHHSYTLYIFTVHENELPYVAKCTKNYIYLPRQMHSSIFTKNNISKSTENLIWQLYNQNHF